MVCVLLLLNCYCYCVKMERNVPTIERKFTVSYMWVRADGQLLIDSIYMLAVINATQHAIRVIQFLCIIIFRMKWMTSPNNQLYSRSIIIIKYILFTFNYSVNIELQYGK